MSRSNPFKKKPRAAKKTFLVYGEGLGEEMILKHFKSEYSCDNGISFKVQSGAGGDASNIIVDATKIPGSYHSKIVVLDNDKPLKEMERARARARSEGITLIENTPCLEAVLLTTLDANTPKGKTSSWYKKKFQSTYIPKKKRSDPNEYTKNFPKALLETMRSKVVELDAMITLFE